MNIIFRAVAALVFLLLAACNSQSSAPSTVPTLISVTPGEGQAIINWVSEPGLTYWLYYKDETDDPASGPVSKSNYTGIIYNFTGYINGQYSSGNIRGLINGKVYSFLITSSDNNSKTGPVSAVMTAKPDLLINSDAWTLSTSPNSNNLRGLAYGNNYYALVGNSNTVYTATHNYPIPGGVTTTDTTGTIHYGDNNSGWIRSTLPSGVSTTNYSGVVYNGSGFVALGEDGSTLYSSATSTWTLGTLATPVPVPVVWTAGTSINASGNTMNALALGGVYVAVGNGGKIFTSPGVTSSWTDVSGSPNPVTNENLYGVSYLNGIYIAVGAHGTLLTSPDGTNWTPKTSNANNHDLYQVAFGLSTYVTDSVSKYVAVGDAGTIIYSTDTTNWSPSNTGGVTQNLRTICFGPAAQFIGATTPLPNSQFIVAGAAGTVLYSSSGADTTPSSWTVSTTMPSLVGANDLNSMVPTDLIMAVGTAGTIVSAP
jgi:hypothetical protein